ncbi:hypothetical protein V2A60_008170 [Cordyceps javanica]
MELILLLASLAGAVTAGLLDNPANKSHPCYGPKDCKIKCENGSYVRTEDKVTGIHQLRCTGRHSDYTYISGYCRREMGPEGLLWDRNRRACELVGGLHCLPYKKEQVKKSMWHRCIFDPADFQLFKEYCEADNYNSVWGPSVSDVPWDCYPDYLR